MAPLDAHQAPTPPAEALDAQDWINEAIAPDSLDLVPPPVDHTNLWKIVYESCPVQIDSSRASGSDSSNPVGSLEAFISQTESGEPVADDRSANSYAAIYGISNEILAQQGTAVRAVIEGRTSIYTQIRILSRYLTLGIY